MIYKIVSVVWGTREQFQMFDWAGWDKEERGLGGGKGGPHSELLKDLGCCTGHKSRPLQWELQWEYHH